MKKGGKVALIIVIAITVILITVLVPCWGYCTKHQTCGETNQSCHSWKPYCKKNVKCPTGQVCSRGRCISDERRFGCDNQGACVEDPQGKWTSQEDCKCFSCEDGSCKVNPDGTYPTKKECNQECHPRTWTCGDQGACVEVHDGSGPYTSPDACECFVCKDNQCQLVQGHGQFKDGKCGQGCVQYMCTGVGEGDGTCKEVPRGTQGAQDECKCIVCNAGACSVVKAGQPGKYRSVQKCNQDESCHSQALGWACDPGKGTCSQVAHGPFNSQEECTCFDCSSVDDTGACVPTQSAVGSMTLEQCQSSACTLKFGCNGDGTCSKMKNGHWTRKEDCKCIGCSDNKCGPVSVGGQGSFPSVQDCKASDCEWLFGCSDEGECVKMKNGHWSTSAGCNCWKCVGEAGPSSSCQLVGVGELGHFDSKLECERNADAKCGWQYDCS
ncbi:MAG: hypothetical protein K0U52_06560 [Gammaproteobacteria bacterium]|nr:hypothetical protein [Gammaproteobacteria bacterium]